MFNIFKKKEKAFYLKLSTGKFENGEILWMGGNANIIVVDVAPKNTRWEKFKRKLGFKVFDPKGYIKVKNYYEAVDISKP